nr:WEB family protein At1g12150-like isoform X1 [Ipomoea batatas]
MVGELNETNLQLRAVTTETEEKATNREEEMQNLEKELAEKDALVERLKLELVQTKELNLAEMKKLKEEMELQETIIGTSVYISLLETEIDISEMDWSMRRDEIILCLDDAQGPVEEGQDECRATYAKEHCPAAKMQAKDDGCRTAARAVEFFLLDRVECESVLGISTAKPGM